jgi:hypothetical protein
LPPLQFICFITFCFITRHAARLAAGALVSFRGSALHRQLLLLRRFRGSAPQSPEPAAPLQIPRFGAPPPAAPVPVPLPLPRFGAPSALRFPCRYDCGFSSEDWNDLAPREQVSNPCLHLFVV